jgi:hypothetical protein
VGDGLLAMIVLSLVFNLQQDHTTDMKESVKGNNDMSLVKSLFADNLLVCVDRHRTCRLSHPYPSCRDLLGIVVISYKG